MTNAHLFGLFLFTAFSTIAFCAECDDDSVKRCRNNVLDALSNNGNTERNEVNNQCRFLRENFDCLLWQSSTCLDKAEQDSNSDAILKSWRYLGSFCESEGNWWTKSCFQREDVKRCEALLPSRGQSTDITSCRSYTNFRDCVSSVVRAECSRDDQKLLGTYLMEKGQQRAWRCPKNYNSFTNSRVASAPLAADTMFSDSAHVSCVVGARNSIEDCNDEFEKSLKEAQLYNDNDMRSHKTCCSVVRLEDCVRTTLRDRCGEQGARETKAMMASTRGRYSRNCDDHTINECSSAVTINVTFFIYILLSLAVCVVYL